MNYCQRGRHSDIYLYGALRGEIACIRCHYESPGVNRVFTSRRLVVEHVKKHENIGHRILPGLLERLISDINLKGDYTGKP